MLKIYGVSTIVAILISVSGISGGVSFASDAINHAPVYEEGSLEYNLSVSPYYSVTYFGETVTLDSYRGTSEIREFIPVTDAFFAHGLTRSGSLRWALYVETIDGFWRAYDTDFLREIDLLPDGRLWF